MVRFPSIANSTQTVMLCTTTSTISSASMATAANQTPSGWHIIASHVGDPVFFITSCQATFRYHDMPIPLYPSIDNGTDSENGKLTFYYPSLFVVDSTSGSFITVERLMGDYFKISICLVYDPPQLRSKANEALGSTLSEVGHIDVQPLPLEKAHFVIQYPIPLAELGVHCCDLTIPAFSSGCKVTLDVVVKGEKLAQETVRAFDHIPITAKVTYSALEVAPTMVPKLLELQPISQPRNEVTFTTCQLLHSPAFQELLKFGDQDLARAAKVSLASGEEVVFAGQIDRATKGFHLACRQQLAELYRAGKGENPDKAVREAGHKVDELARNHTMKKCARLPLWSCPSSDYFPPNDSPRLLIDGVDVSAAQVTKELNNLFRAVRTSPETYVVNPIAMLASPGWRLWGAYASHLVSLDQDGHVREVKQWTKEQLREELRERYGIHVEFLGAYIIAVRLDLVLLSPSRMLRPAVIARVRLPPAEERSVRLSELIRKTPATYGKRLPEHMLPIIRTKEPALSAKQELGG